MTLYDVWSVRDRRGASQSQRSCSFRPSQVNYNPENSLKRIVAIRCVNFWSNFIQYANVKVRSMSGP